MKIIIIIINKLLVLNINLYIYKKIKKNILQYLNLNKVLFKKKIKFGIWFEFIYLKLA